MECFNFALYFSCHVSFLETSRLCVCDWHLFMTVICTRESRLYWTRERLPRSQRWDDWPVCTEMTSDSISSYTVLIVAGMWEISTITVLCIWRYISGYLKFQFVWCRWFACGVALCSVCVWPMVCCITVYGRRIESGRSLYFCPVVWPRPRINIPAPKWPILCRVGRKTLAQSINFSTCCRVYLLRSVCLRRINIA